MTLSNKALKMSSIHSIPLEILDDLASRFIINVPDYIRNDLIRICFQVRDTNVLCICFSFSILLK